MSVLDRLKGLLPSIELDGDELDPLFSAEVETTQVPPDEGDSKTDAVPSGEEH